VRDFREHPGIGAGNTGKAKRADRGTGQQYVQVLDGNGDLAKLSGFVASYEKYIKALTQYRLSGFSNFAYEFCLEVGGSGRVMLGLEILTAPAAFRKLAIAEPPT
jgi:hypothetical protein